MAATRVPGTPGRTAFVLGGGGMLGAAELAGATLLQTYTGFVYGGPTWPARMQRAFRSDAEVR